MDSKKLIGGICLLSFACGLFGGMVGAWFFAGNDPNPTFKTVTVTDALVVKTDDSQDVGCKLLPDGTATLTGGLIANQVRGRIFSGQNFLASTNPLHAALDDQRVMVQMVADPNSGGQLIARSREATFVPGQGAPASGNVAVIAFNQQNGRAEIFTQDIAAGEASRSYMLAMRPRATQTSTPPTDATTPSAGDPTVARSPAASVPAENAIRQ